MLYSKWSKWVTSEPGINTFKLLSESFSYIFKLYVMAGIKNKLKVAGLNF